jgi:hypothetical protein
VLQPRGEEADTTEEACQICPVATSPTYPRPPRPRICPRRRWRHHRSTGGDRHPPKQDGCWGTPPTAPPLPRGSWTGGRRRTRRKSSTAPPPSGGKRPATAILAAHPGCVEVAPFDGGVARGGAERGWRRLGFGAPESSRERATRGKEAGFLSAF